MKNHGGPLIMAKRERKSVHRKRTGYLSFTKIQPFSQMMEQIFLIKTNIANA